MDPNQIFQGGTVSQTEIEAKWHQEQERKKYDIIRVSNPTQATVGGVLYDLPNEKSWVQYDVNMHQSVEFGQTKDMPRYIADRYMEHMKDKIINFVAKKMHDDFIEDRRKKGLPEYTDKHVENNETYLTQKYPRTDNPELIAEVYDQLWIGLVLRVENTAPPDVMQTHQSEINVASNHVRAMERLENKRVDTIVPDVTSSVRPYVAQTRTGVPSESSFSKLNQQLGDEDQYQ